MGIKGVYGEIGSGQRISISKLAIEHFEETGKPFRLAIDISIWQFQVQAGKGGSNPTLRTLYYRLLRLLSLAIQPLFVFDGPHKPPFKRGKRTTATGASALNNMTKQMLKLFGFAYHDAPGEAEAECALLQRAGIVDAVLSEDVDTLMFGCQKTLRNWSSEASRGNHPPTHVSVYNADATKQGKAGLDREGMILVALMSGGDYIPEGVPGCGIKVACEAARGGFGASLCRISNLDSQALHSWRSSLMHELHTNENNIFRVKHKALKIPDSFPNLEVLNYYTNPVVSSNSNLQRLKEDIIWNQELNVEGLRRFCGEVFEWTNASGAVKFIRGLAPVLLVAKLMARVNRRASGYGDILLTAINEMEIVRAIQSKRTHFSSDGLTELRLIYRPLDIVPIDLDAEHDDSVNDSRSGLAPAGEDGNLDGVEAEDATTRSQSPTKRGTSLYDPTQPDKVWVLETIAKLGIPLKVQDYEEALRNPTKYIKQKATAKRAAIKSGMPRGALDKYVKVTKITEADHVEKYPSTVNYIGPRVQSVSAIPASSLAEANPSWATTTVHTSIKSTRSIRATKQLSNFPSHGSKPINPWTASSSQKYQYVGATKPLSTLLDKPDDTSRLVDIPSSPPTPMKNFRDPDKHASCPAINPLHRSLNTTSISPSPSRKRTTHTISDTRRRPRASVKNPKPVDVIEKLAFSTTKIDRKLDFDIRTSSQTKATSPDEELPDLDDLLSPPVGGRSKLNIDIEKSTGSTSDFVPSSSKSPRPHQLEKSLPPSRVPKAETLKNTRTKGKEFIVLRQSLEGSWKQVDEEEKLERESRSRNGMKVWRMSSIEVIDMTEE